MFFEFKTITAGGAIQAPFDVTIPMSGVRAAIAARANTNRAATLAAALVSIR